MHSPGDQADIPKITDTETLAANSWIVGGKIGGKDTVLVFRTCAVTTTSTSIATAKHEETDDQRFTSTSGVKSKNQENIQPHSILEAQNSNKSNTQQILLTKVTKKPTTAKVRKKCDKLLKERTEQKPQISLSSSETSISSACDDPTDIETDIIQGLEQENTMSTSELALSTSKSSEEPMDEKENISDDLVDGNVESEEMPGAMLKISFRFTNTETRLLRKILTSHGLIEAEESENFCLLWTGIHIKPDILRNLTPYQRVNHFPRSYELTRKDRLYKNVEKMQHLRGFKHFNIVPLSFMLPHEYRDLVSAHRSDQRGPWIVKPAASSRGRGIFIVNSPDQISMDDQVLVSKYIADPLCIDGHKCDIRLYVAVTSFDPLLIYMYEEGLVRLATVKYEKNVENLWNPCMHLCNYSINKYHSDYIKATDSCEDVGHKWTFSALLRHLKSQGCDTKELMQNIEDVIIKSIFSCCQSIVSACRMFVPNGNNCFELYGFDILIDDTLKPWLLEVNLSPSLGIDTPLDAKVKASLLTDLLTLVGIPALYPSTRAAYDSKWSRFKTSYSRKSNSSEHLSMCSKKTASTTNQLTSEELRILRNVRAQNNRSGGFLRIYPTEDSMQKYSSFLDPVTGIPLSATPISGSATCAMLLPHNYNQMLFNQLYPQTIAAIGGEIEERMKQYERALEMNPLNILTKSTENKSTDEARRLRKQIRKLIEGGNEMSHLQARKAFSHYLEFILKRLTQEPKNQQEKIILKFITRSSMSIKTPSFIKNPYSQKIYGKDRSAMVAKLLGDYLESYNRDTEAYVDSFDRYGMIPTKMFNDFLGQAQEIDLESILTLHTNLTKTMPFLYHRCATATPQTPPIPSGVNGFLKALPAMAPINIATKDSAKIETYYRSLTSIPNERESEESTYNDSIVTRSDTRVSTKYYSMPSLKKRSSSQPTVNNSNKF